MEFRTEQSREKIQGVQDGTEQRDRRYMELRTEQSREKIQGVYAEREQK